MPRRQPEVEQRSHLDWLVQAHVLQARPFALGQFGLVRLTPGRKLARRPLGLRQAGQVGPAVTQVGPGDPAALLQGRERNGVVADDDAEAGLRVTLEKTDQLHRGVPRSLLPGQNSTSIPLAFATARTASKTLAWSQGASVASLRNSR